MTPQKRPQDNYISEFEEAVVPLIAFGGAIGFFLSFGFWFLLRVDALLLTGIILGATTSLAIGYFKLGHEPTIDASFGDSIA